MRIYLCAALMDLIIFLVIFAVTYGAGERGMTMWECAWLVGAMQATYMVASLLSGWILSRRNARVILVGSVVGMALASLACLSATRFWPLAASMGALGIAGAVFFNSFQSFMRSEAQPGELAQTIGLYTLAWSSGSSVGFLASGSLYRLGPVALCALTLLVTGVILTVLLRHRARPHDAPSVDEHTEESSNGTGAAHATYVWIGWIMIFTTLVVQRPIHAFFPALNAGHGVAPFLVSLPLFLHMLLQGLFGCWMQRLRGLLYRSGPLLATQVGAAVLLLILCRTHSLALAAIGISLLGLWAGFTFFCAVYYASNSGHRARNIGVNEFLVGFGSLAGLLICGHFMTAGADASTLYAICATALLASAAIQGLVIVLRRAKVSAP